MAIRNYEIRLIPRLHCRTVPVDMHLNPCMLTTVKGHATIVADKDAEAPRSIETILHLDKYVCTRVCTHTIHCMIECISSITSSIYTYVKLESV